MNLKNHLLLLVFSLLFSGTPLQGWTPQGPLDIPAMKYSFLSVSPQGDLMAATFNSAPAGSPPAEMPVVLVRDPLASSQVTTLSSVPFAANRGYSGIACDPSSGFYVSGDTGNRADSFVMKFRFDGSMDQTFGQGGGIYPGRRALGMEVLGDYLFVAVDWGEIMVLNKSTGAKMGMVPQIRNAFIRDIALDPKSMRIFGVAAGALYTWGGGAPWQPQTYQSRQLTQQAGDVRSGEGISFDPIKRTLLNTPIPGNHLLELYGSGDIVTHTITSADGGAHLADSVLSFDGRTLFVSDITGQKIHSLSRNLNEVATAQSSSGAARTSADVDGGGAAKQVKWYRSYTEIVQEARERSTPMIVYFRSAEFAGCEEFEKDVLLTPGFNRRAQDYVCVFEDVSIDPLLAYRFGVFRVPHIVILDPNGETRAEFSGSIDAGELFETL